MLCGLPRASAADEDGDGIPGPFDNCLYVPNAPPLDCDVDADGFGSACDMGFDNDSVVRVSDAGDFELLFGTLGVPSLADGNCDQIVEGAGSRNLHPALRSGRGSAGPFLRGGDSLPVSRAHGVPAGEI